MTARKLPDRSHVGPGLRAAVFLFRQPFLLWPAVIGALVLSGWLLTISIQNGRASAESVAILIALAPVLGFGTAVLTALPGWFVVRAITGRAPALTLERGEEEVLSCRANHFLGDEGRGGKLHVTTRAVTFVPHRFNIQLSVRRVPLASIESVAWARVIGPSGMPLSCVLEIATRDGTDTFVVERAAEIADLVDRLHAAGEAAP
jgi:hypothetical protein